jgi:hypothetical protein
MSNRKHRMRMDEAGLKITEDFVLSHNGAGEILNEYRRLKTPLQLWLRNGLRLNEYAAGVRYGEIWRHAWKPRSPPHSDTTRIVVDGSGAPPEPFFPFARDWETLGELAKVIGDPETVQMLDRLCGHESWPAGDKRRFKRKCRRGLEVLAVFWRRR